MTFRIVTSVVVLFLGACGKSSPPAPDKGAPASGSAPAPASGIDVDGFCERTMAGKNPAQCYGKDTRAERIKSSMCSEVLGGALSQGHVTIDPAKLAACERATIAAIASLDNQRSLSDLAETFAECRDVATGKQAAGADCLGSMECVPGLVCMQMKCAARGADGAACQPLIEMTLSAAQDTCAAGLHCDLADAHCHPLVAAGGACRLTRECTDGLRCREEKCVAAKPSVHDGPCDENKDCPAGDACSLGGHCEALRADGAECLTDSQCAHQCVNDHCGPCPG